MTKPEWRKNDEFRSSKVQPMNFRSFGFRGVISMLIVVAVFSPALAQERLTFEGNVQISVRARSQLDFWKPADSVADSGPKPEGRAVRLRGETGGGFSVNATAIATDWRQVESIGLWLHRSAEEAKEHPTVELVLRLSEEDQKGSFWRRLEVSHVGWQKLVLPLEWFVWSDGRQITHDHVDSMDWLDALRSFPV